MGEIARFQGILGEYQIVIIDFHARNGVIYEGPSRGKKIVLYKNGDHYDVANPEKMPALFAKRFYCEICKVFYDNNFHHSYNDPCNTCLHKPCSLVRGEGGKCPDCFKYCRSLKCVDAHMKTCKSKGLELPSRCVTSFKCRKCQSVVERTRQDEHRCEEFKCDICKTFVLPGHLSFM